ncbi:type II secretion system F family protein [Vibrio makurazakiensis]|uniref:type II secretion system F family protein n=1 Tax=Vibrio makurazakiensis TaxID=2910250 RepID=UPI003D14C083
MIIVVLLLCLLAAVSWGVRYQSKHRIVRKRLAQFSNHKLVNSQETSIRKSNQLRGNALHALFIRVDSLLTKADKVAIALITIGLPVGCYFLFPKVPAHLQMSAVLSAWVICVAALSMYRKRLQIEEFEQGIIHVLGLISRAVSAGLSIPQAIDQVAQTQPGLLGREFSNISDNLALGLSLRHSLDDACIRLPYSSFRYFSVALILNQANGGQLREILHSLSRTMHDNRAMRKKVKSLTSEPRMTALFLSVLPIGLLGVMAWMEPTMVDLLLESESGQSVMIYVVGSISLGAICLNAMTRNKRFAS